MASSPPKAASFPTPPAPRRNPLLHRSIAAAFAVLFTTGILYLVGPRLELPFTTLWSEQPSSESPTPLSDDGPPANGFRRPFTLTCGTDSDPSADSPTERIVFGTGFAEVTCYPSTGGVWIADSVSAVELDLLGLDRFQVSQRSSDAEEEDAFCRKLRKVGAKWWFSGEEYAQSVAIRLPDSYAASLYLGWPEDGGVWVLKIDGVDGRPADGPEGVGRISNAHTMEERCKALEMMGAVFHRDPEECADLKDLSSLKPSAGFVW